jgi:hypothetical protein
MEVRACATRLNSGEGYSCLDQAKVPPLRKPTRSPFEAQGKQEVNAKKRRRLAPVGMTTYLCLGGDFVIRRSGRDERL